MNTTRRVIAILCNLVGIVCWGTLTWSGIFEKNVRSIWLYSLTLIATIIALILNILALKKQQ